MENSNYNTNRNTRAYSLSLPVQQTAITGLKHLFLLLFFLFLFKQASASEPIPTNSLVFDCIETVEVDLNDDCSFQLTPITVITGVGLDTIDSYTVTIDGLETDLITSCGDHVYNIDLIEDGVVVFSCTGTLSAINQLQLAVDCPEDISTVTQEVSALMITDSLETTDEQIELNTFSCFGEGTSPGMYTYDSFTFTVNEAGVYSFVGEMTNSTSGAILALFNGDHFTPANPCEDYKRQIEMLNLSPENVLLTAQNHLVMLLNPGSYTLMIAGIVLENETAVYSIYNFSNGLEDISGFGQSTELSLTRPLVCMDVDEVFFTEQQHYSIAPSGVIIPDSITNEVNTKLTYTGFPIVSDHCGVVDVSITDELVENGDCGTWVITRTFSIADRAEDNCTGSVQTSTCTQMIVVRKATLDDIVLPPLTTGIACDSDYLTDGEVGGEDENPHQSIIGYPLLVTSFGTHELAETQCNLSASYSDEPRINVCTGIFKFRREWSIVDWCSPGNTMTYHHIIAIRDEVGPSFYVPIPDYNNDGSSDDCFRYSTSPFACEANIPIPFAVDVEDANGCSEVAERKVFVRTDQGDFISVVSEGDTVSLIGGDYIFTWCFEDECENETCIDYCVIVRDEIEPNVFCQQVLSVNIGNGDILNGVEGGARVSAETIDNGSLDNCGEITLDVRRNYWQNDTCSPDSSLWSEWGAFVDFYCCDVTTNISVELRVTDGVGNTGTCMTDVTVSDNLAPVCLAPQSISVALNDIPAEYPADIQQAYDSDFEGTAALMNELFGETLATDNCAVDTVVERTPDITINDCGWGQLTRRFEAWQWRPEGDLNGNGELDRDEAFVSTNTCQQVILFIETHDFVIDFPQDAVASCDDICIWGVETEAIGQDIIAVNISEGVHTPAVGDECYQLNITYDVINWCLWDGEYEGYTIPRMTDIANDGGLDSLSVESTERPVIFGNNDGVRISRSNEARTICPDGSGGFFEGDDSELLETICINDNMANAGLCNGRWNYTQVIKVYDTTVPTIEVGTFGGATDLCPDIETGQFCAPFEAGVANISIPVMIYDTCQLANLVNPFAYTVVSAQLDLLAIDTNEDGVIDESEFNAEDENSDVSEQLIDLGNGVLEMTGEYPAIVNETADSLYHAIQITLVDACGHEVRQIINFDVTLADEIVAIDEIDEINTGLKVFQNKPNPFTNETVISFELANFGEVSIQFIDLHGRVINTIQKQFPVGMNEVKITKEMLKDQHGLLFYTVTNENNTVMKKMIIH